jgi:hypothetical protein
MSKVIKFVTGNQNKLREVKLILEKSDNLSWTLESQSLDGMWLIDV